jgi:hypothetical protein
MGLATINEQANFVNLALDIVRNEQARASELVSVGSERMALL